MAINFSPKVGEILECNFGNYPVSQNGQFSTKYYDGRIPPEMIKNRLVVVLNGKINGNACIVVPLSTTRDHDKLKRGMHVEIASNVNNGCNSLISRFVGPKPTWYNKSVETD